MAEVGKISKYNIALGGLMKIRDHPSLVHWPPEWIASFDNESLPIDKREELVLKEVEVLSTAPHDYHSYIRLSAELQQEIYKIYQSPNTLKTYKGAKPEKKYSSIIIFMRDSEFLDRLYNQLTRSIGRTIREIGDAEI
jgi:hypothetical protein